tara:strand:- start:134 stop:466 length:333 start_codon:yes stop_codon:yes gene_type:complete
MNTAKSNWLFQRISALILVPLILWFIYKLIGFNNYYYDEVIKFYSSTVNCLLFIIMFVIMTYHSRVGIKTIVEDYIDSKKIRKNIISAITILSYTMIIIIVISIAKIKFF